MRGGNPGTLLSSTCWHPAWSRKSTCKLLRMLSAPAYFVVVPAAHGIVERMMIHPPKVDPAAHSAVNFGVGSFLLVLFGANA